MSLYNGPARGGNRGGKDQFNWDSVKSDKDREFYLGHSVKATTGRWQKGKDVFWYTREKQEEEAAKARLEMQAIKQREEDLMNEALGLKPKTLKQTAKPKLDSQDMAKLLGRTDSEEQGQPDPMQDPDAVKGLGYKPNMMTGVASAGRDVLGGIGVDEDSAAALAQDGPADTLPGPPPRLSVAELKQLVKKQEKAASKAHKEAKKAKKEAKKAKKHKEKDKEKCWGLHSANGRHLPAAVTDSSMSPDADSPPRRRAQQHYEHAAELQEQSQHNRESQYDHSQDKRKSERYEPDDLKRHLHGRSSHRQHSRSPSRRHVHASRSPMPERHHNPHASRSTYFQERSYWHVEENRHRNGGRHGRNSPSASPPRRRHRS